MSNWLQWDIEDERGENPTGKPGEFAFSLEFDYDPGDPGCIRDQNGDGFPGYQPSVSVARATCKEIKLYDEETRPPAQNEIKPLEDWFMSVIEDDAKLRRQIELCGLDQMCVEPDCDDVYD